MPKGTKVAVAEAALPIVVEGKSLTKRDIEWILRSARHFGTGASAEITKILCQIALGEREIEPGHTSLVAYQDEKVADTEKRF